ncbi:hypothetical protein [Streptomyces sp. NPDC096934]|uniref:RipA family octameric membrane protein n=1 Tax=Streptomyces sp. NPDC096934 TaxID=3155551 RepID=UPI00331B292E
MTLRGLVRSYFVRGFISVDDARSGLWTTSVSAATYADVNEKYQAAILEQYKIYVEAADRISARRGMSNTFFLTVNTAIFSALSFVGGIRSENHWAYAALLLVLLVQCSAWFWILKSFRQLSSAKFRVIGALEERLPASPFWRAEWKAIGEGKDKSRYWPVSQLEQWIPCAFALAYVLGFLIILVVD